MVLGLQTSHFEAKFRAGTEERNAPQCVQRDIGAKMRSADQYANYAAECVRVAQATKDAKDKAMLLRMAETWRRLAEQAAHKEKQDNF